ncbi:MAG: acetate--CoA ligase [Candidatus Rokubacteria bacterium]|nr:acetate--CoA ligase [Candidatus Rokubacteria bacterium]
MNDVAPQEIVWRPTAQYLERSRIARFLKKEGVVSLPALHQRSVADPEWFWRAVCADIGVQWITPFRRVLDESRGVAWPRWFEGGELNLSANCLDRWLPGRANEPALIWEAEDGESRTLTYAQMTQAVGRLANALTSLGIRAGDAIGIFLPMSPEAAIATLAVTRIGAIYTPCFSGYGAHAVASRLQDCEAKLLITADGFHRRGQPIAMKTTADEAVAMSPSVKQVLVVKRTTGDVPWAAGRDRWWHDVVDAQSPECPPLPVDADRPCLIIYTSGTTGKPKGTVLTQGGFLIKCASDWAYVMDVGEGDRVFWLTDLGWLMGPMLITGTLFNGGTAVMFEGTPDYPKPDRLWELAERHRVNVMGFSPTAARALMPYGADWVARHDLSALRIIGSTGEPWNPEPFRWVLDNVGGGRVPIINYSGGTECSGGIVASFPILPVKPCSFAGPIPGVATEVFGDDAKPVRGQVGELVVTRPWPGMTQGFWKDPQRYEETYWSRWPNVWVHGDWAYVDDDGFWFLQGRSDDTLKIAGKRLGPAEVESVLVGHAAVAEAATIGVPHEIKGEAVVCFVVLKSGQQASEPLRAELAALVMHQMGKALKPERVLFVRDLPRTRSMKIMRRVIRATYLGKDPGDVSSLENPAALRAISEAV